MTNTGLANTEATKFTQQTKQEMAQWLKQTMTEKRLHIPYDSELIAELNIECYALTKDGKIQLSHPPGTHDDRFWALALAVYAARTPPPPQLWIIPKTNTGKTRLNKLRQKLNRHKTEGTIR
ncbi:MAG: hypothetical protein QXX34_01095 [Candidatus Bathyarchaeia archaeon]